MKLDTLTLRNFQSYDYEVLDFEDGVTLIHGDNGAGKSTILRAIFAGLYQADATTETSADYSLADLVRKTEDEGSVELTFSVGAETYTIEWVITVAEEDEERKGSTKSCVLTGGQLEEPISGVREVRGMVERIVGMDATSFANSVYVQQKRLSRLIEANASERKEILDGLLGLTKIDEYTNRMKFGRRPVKSTRDDAQSRRKEVQERIDRYDENELNTKQQEHAERISKLEEQREAIVDIVNDDRASLTSLKDDLKEYQASVEERERLEKSIESRKGRVSELNEKIRENELTIQEKQDEINRLEDKLDELNAVVSEFDLLDEESAREAVTELESTWETTFGEVQDAKSTVSQLQQTRDRLENDLSDAERGLEDAQTTLEDAKAELEDAELEVTEAEQQLNTITERLTEATGGFDRDLEAMTFMLPGAVQTLSLAAPTELDREDVVAARDALDAAREARGNTLRELTTKRESLGSQLEELEAELSDATSKQERLLSRLSADIESPESKLQARLDDVESALSDLGLDDETVSIETLDSLLSTTLPAARQEAVSTLRAAASDVAQSRAKSKYHEYVETTLSEHGIEPDVVSLTTESQGEATNTAEAAEESFEDAVVRFDDLDTATTAVVDCLQLRTLSEVFATISELQGKTESVEGNIEALNTQIATARSEQETLESLVSTAKQLVTAINLLTEARRDFTEAENARGVAADAVEEVRDAVEEVETTHAAVDEELDETKTRLSEAEAEHERVKATLETVSKKRGAARDAASHHDDVSDCVTVIESATDSIKEHRETVDSVRADITEFKNRLSALTESLEADNIESLRQSKQAAEAKLGESERKLKLVDEKLSEKRTALTKVEEKLSSLSAERERATELDARIGWADDIEQELTRVIDTYQTVKMELREQTLGLLNQYTNDVFSDLYQNESYVGVRIDEDYGIELIAGDGTSIDPNKCSGGEGVLTNIALRAGVYRVIAEQDASAGAGLPPFLLDEPTNFLDDTHVAQIEGVIHSIEDWDVPQVILVSHREALMFSADQKFYVAKNPASDTSSVEVDAGDDDEVTPEAKPQTANERGTEQ
jgi:DNA repair exonuclease SbcCD ATPase subunit